jgi:hypothetical protein
MLKAKDIAIKVNDELRDISRRLDESAALVRREAPEEATRYAVAVGKVFEVMTEELLLPLYRDHPDIAPPIWNEMQESKK